MVDFKEAFSCTTSVTMDTVLLDVKLIGVDFAMSVARFVSVFTVLDIFIDLRLPSALVLDTGECVSICVFGVGSFVAKYPLTVLPSTAKVRVDKCSDK